MQCHFIKTCAALGTIGLAGTAFAGDTVRFDVNFSDVDIFFTAPGDMPSNAQLTQTADPGRYFASVGWSNVDVDVCWNGDSAYSGWAEEIVFAATLSEAGTTAWLDTPSPFAGDQTGSETPDTCSNRQALAEVDFPLAVFTYQVDASGEVETGMKALWDDGTGLRHSEVNTADFYFTLAGAIPEGCDGATGSCGEQHPTPGCEDLSCCSITCDANVGGDPFCCTDSWDSTCVTLAVELCGIYQYSCEAPSQANDCATSPQAAGNGEAIAFNTAGANTDGPDEIGCGSGYEDYPIWSDLWYMIELTGDSTVTASCCNTADFDSKIAIYAAGEVGSTFDPATLPDSFIACNEDCDDPDFFTSELVVPSLAEGQYLIRIGGYQAATGSGDITISWEDPAPQLPDPSCDNPGGTDVSQIITADENLTISGGVGCGAGAENVTARSYPAAAFGGAFDVSCINFGWFMNDVDAYIPTIINLYVQDAASPLDVTSQELVGTTSCGLRSGPEGVGYTISSQSFDAPVNVDLAEGEFLMVEVRIQRQVQEGGADGYGGYFGVILADTDGAESYISCGGDYFGSLTDIGFGDYQAYITINGDGAGGSTCTGDFNDDGQVNGADFGAILAAWGPCPGCPEDLNDDGTVGGADVGLLLSVWGPCDP
ncbi:MAG: hypothetical protein GY895_07935 [Phycisphaera sp.]|nr:hypothetical protein [Phycisphaera sp.]